MNINNKDRLKELIEDYAESLSEMNYEKEEGYSHKGIIAAENHYDFCKRELNTFLDSMYIVDRRKDS